MSFNGLTNLAAREARNLHWRKRLMRRSAIDDAGHAHELTFTCLRGYPFLKAELTCQWLADAIDVCRRELDFQLWAYVFMPEHVHLLIVPNQQCYAVAEILKAIKEPVGRKAVAYLREHDAEWLERITVRHGQRLAHRFWQPGGGFDRNALDPHVILRMIEYIHANPVRRGLVIRPAEWHWSSADWVIGKNSLRPDPVIFGGDAVFSGGRE